MQVYIFDKVAKVFIRDISNVGIHTSKQPVSFVGSLDRFLAEWYIKGRFELIHGTPIETVKRIPLSAKNEERKARQAVFSFIG